jgi:gas vesicle protein
MKYGKLVARILAKKSNNNAQIAIALVAGLAAGAVISILFAPDNGANVRGSIRTKAKNLGSDIKDSYATLKHKMLDNGLANKVSNTHIVQKKRKSPIKASIPDTNKNNG